MVNANNQKYCQKRNQVLKPIGSWRHEQTGHTGKGMTFSAIQNSTLWIVSAKSVRRGLALQ